MKFGVLAHKTTMNLGDDIQSYAAACLLPSVEVMVDREALNSFVTEDGKPVGLIMSAWYMWKKWNWPPSKYIVPLMVGFHHFERSSIKKGLPLMREHLNGIGGRWMSDYSPIGCRDTKTTELLTELGIDSYFSGCITLTLPKQSITADAKTYICLVDVTDQVKSYIKKKLTGTEIMIRELSHVCDYRKSTATWEQRSDIVEKRLQVYQNALCVITPRLHVALPCLAMETPVLLLKEHSDENAKQFDYTRFDPYYDWLHLCDEDELIKGVADFDIIDPPANKNTYLTTRNRLIEAVRRFVELYRDNTESADDLNRASFTTHDCYIWQLSLMKTAFEKVLKENEEIANQSILIKNYAKIIITMAKEGLSKGSELVAETETERKAHQIGELDLLLSRIRDRYGDLRRAIEIKELGILKMIDRKIKKTI